MQVKDGKLLVLVYAITHNYSPEQLREQAKHRGKKEVKTLYVERTIETAFWELVGENYSFYNWFLKKHVSISKKSKYRSGKEFPWMPLVVLKEYDVLGKVDKVQATAYKWDGKVIWGLKFLKTTTIDGKEAAFVQEKVAIRSYQIELVRYKGRLIDDLGKVIREGVPEVFETIKVRFPFPPDPTGWAIRQRTDGFTEISFSDHRELQEFTFTVEMFSGDRFAGTMRP